MLKFDRMMAWNLKEGFESGSYRDYIYCRNHYGDSYVDEIEIKFELVVNNSIEKEVVETVHYSNVIETIRNKVEELLNSQGEIDYDQVEDYDGTYFEDGAHIFEYNAGGKEITVKVSYFVDSAME